MLAAVLLAAGGIAAAPELLPPPPAVDSVAFEAAYADLDADDLAVRERAVLSLQRMGRGAVPLLGARLAKGSAEQRERCRQVLQTSLLTPESAALPGFEALDLLLGSLPAALDALDASGDSSDITKGGTALSDQRETLGLPAREADAQAFAVQRLLEFRKDPAQGELAALLALEIVQKGGIPVLEKILPILPDLFSPPLSKGTVTVRGKLAGGQGTFSRTQQGVRHQLFQNATTQIAYRVTAASPESLPVIAKAFADLAADLSGHPDLEGKIDMTYVFRAASWGKPEEIQPPLSKSLGGKLPARDRLAALGAFLRLTRQDKPSRAFWASLTQPRAGDWGSVYVAAGLLRSGHPDAAALISRLPKPAEGPAQVAWKFLESRASGKPAEAPAGSEVAVAFACVLTGLPPTAVERKALETALADPYPFHDLDAPPFWDLWGKDAKALLEP